MPGARGSKSQRLPETGQFFTCRVNGLKKISKALALQMHAKLETFAVEAGLRQNEIQNKQGEMDRHLCEYQHRKDISRALKFILFYVNSPSVLHWHLQKATGRWGIGFPCLFQNFFSAPERNHPGFTSSG